ncbi:MAG: hypothetical protein WCV90_03785 [Candidatus Woesearchaeota archaeon]
MFNVSLEQLMSEEDLKRCAIVESRIPLFGEKTEEVCRNWLSWFDHYQSRVNPAFHYRTDFRSKENQEFALQSVSLRVQLGAIAKNINRGKGKAVELYSGIGIPAAAYTLLSGQPAICIEGHPADCQKGKDLFNQLDFRTMDVTDFLPLKEVTSEGVIIMAYGAKQREVMSYLFKNNLSGGIFLNGYSNNARRGYTLWSFLQGYKTHFYDLDKIQTLMRVERK